MSGPETLPTLPNPRRIHPLIGTAAVAVVIASLTAVAAITGVLPIGKASQGPGTEAYPAQSQAQPQAQYQSQPQSRDGDNAQAHYAANTAGNTQPQPNAGVNAGAQPYGPETQAPAPGSTTRPPAYDARQAQRTMPPPAAQQAQAEQKSAPRPSHTAGHVTGVQVVETEKPTSGLGAVGGAVVGGLLGNQIGNGNGRILGTVAGAAAGGFGGNYAEKKLNTNKTYRVSVQMDDGSRRTFTYQNPPGVEVGQRVHLERGALVTG